MTGFSGGSDGKESACNARDLGSIPGLGKSPGEGNGNPLPYSCLENSIDRGVWWAIVHKVARVRDDFSAKPPPFILYKHKLYSIYFHGSEASAF